MFSKEFMRYLSEKDERNEDKTEIRESSTVTKPLLYIILKYKTAPKGV